MQGYSILKTVFDKIISTGLTNRVFHSVKKFTANNDETYPIYPIGGDEYSYVGIDDTKVMTVYCRQIDDLRTITARLVGGCGQLQYVAVIPHRIVLFNDFEKRSQDELIRRFMQFVFLPNVRLLKIIVDKEKLVQAESTAKGFNFGEETFYVGIDFEITVNLSKDNCETEIGCYNILNPYTNN